MKFLVTLLLALSFSVSCGEDWDPGFFCFGSAGRDTLPDGVAVEKIVNGTRSIDRRATVALFADNGDFICSGVALDSQVVLTAAHCVGTGGINVGTSFTSERIVVDDRYVHPAYVVWPDWDLAVLHLAEPIEGPFPVGIYDPAEGGYDPDLRRYCTHMLVQGFGKVAEGDPRGLYELEYVAGTVRWLTLVTSAADNPDTDAVCSGDSGSPMYAFTNDRNTPGQTHMWVAGIASTGSADGCVGRGEHVFLENFSPWVSEVRHCMNGGEDRLWGFQIGSFRGSTCEEARKHVE